MSSPTPRRPRPPNGASTAKVLAFLQAECIAGRPWPTALQIAQHMGWKNASSVRDLLGRLVAAGHIRRVNVRPFGPSLRRSVCDYVLTVPLKTEPRLLQPYTGAV